MFASKLQRRMSRASAACSSTVCPSARAATAPREGELIALGAADVMSIDSGPESEFKFQDLDEAGNGRKGKRAPGLKVGTEIPQEAIENAEIASAYGLSGRKIQIKRRSQSSQ